MDFTCCPPVSIPTRLAWCCIKKEFLYLLQTSAGVLGCEKWQGTAFRNGNVSSQMQKSKPMNDNREEEVIVIPSQNISQTVERPRSSVRMWSFLHRFLYTEAKWLHFSINSAIVGNCTDFLRLNYLCKCGTDRPRSACVYSDLKSRTGINKQYSYMWVDKLSLLLCAKKGQIGPLLFTFFLG